MDDNGKEKVLWKTLTKILRESGNEASIVLPYISEAR